MSDKDSLYRAKKAYKLVQEDLQGIENSQERDAIPKLLNIFENCIDAIKDLKNQRPEKEHKMKTIIFKRYYELGILKKEYSESHKRLHNLKQMAEHGPYAREKTHPLKDKELKGFIKGANELASETEGIIKENSSGD